MATLTLRTQENRPLTNLEIDNNFINLNNDLAGKYDTADFTGANILTHLLSVDGTGSGLDADLLDGLNATSDNIPSTVVARDASGDLSARIVLADLLGDVQGNVVGDLLGDVQGNLTGNVLGNLVGDVIGNLQGNVVGNTQGLHDGAIGELEPDLGTFTFLKADDLEVNNYFISYGPTSLGSDVIVNSSSGTQGQVLTSRGTGYSPEWTSVSVDLLSNASGILQPTNGGTGLSDPGANGNILVSDGINWVSLPFTIQDDTVSANTLDNTVQSGDAPVFAARAFGSITGSSFPSINSRGNIATLTRSGVGVYTIAFTDALPSSSYVTTVSSADNASLRIFTTLNKTASGFTVHCYDLTGTLADGSFEFIVIG